MLKMFYKYLVSFHSTNNLPEFNYPKSFSFPNVKESINNHIKIKNRLHNHRVSNNLLETLKKFLSTEPVEFNLSSMPGLIKVLP